MLRRTYAIAAKWFPLVLVIGIALFFRLYKLREFYFFEHDQDLYSFIVRDILSGHFRLIGQLTSIDGGLIGTLYWYLYALFITLRGDKKGLVLFGILAGLIWHIHVALLPLLFLIPVSMMMAKIDPHGLKAAVFSSSLKIRFFPRMNAGVFSLGIKYDRKYVLWAIAFFVFLTLPFWLYEIRHGFQQISGLIASIGQDRNGIKGVERLFLAIDGW